MRKMKKFEEKRKKKAKRKGSGEKDKRRSWLKLRVKIALATLSHGWIGFTQHHSKPYLKPINTPLFILFHILVLT